MDNSIFPIDQTDPIEWYKEFVNRATVWRIVNSPDSINDIISISNRLMYYFKICKVKSEPYNVMSMNNISLINAEIDRIREKYTLFRRYY